MQEHLMVDGNNALHAIPSLAKELAADRSQARDSLLRLLEPLVTEIIAPRPWSLTVGAGYIPFQACEHENLHRHSFLFVSAPTESSRRC